jgi:hypothetical protein
MKKALQYAKSLEECPAGRMYWKQFEDLCIEILRYLFVPPLRPPKIQVRTYSGIDRRDAIFPNRNFSGNNAWAQIYRELKARLILFEFKNYASEQIDKDDVIQANSYLRRPMGRLAILCCNKTPNRSAHIKSNSIFGEEGKVILFVTKDHLKEMLFIKERGENPGDLILDLIEWFYMRQE